MRTLIAALLTVVLAACSPASHHEAAPAASAPAATTAAAPQTASTAGTPPAAAGPSAPASASSAASASRAGVAHHAGNVLTRYHWQLATAVDAKGGAIGALFARPGKPLQLDFTDRGLAIGNACNRMHANYTAAAGKLVIGEFASTLMACGDPKLSALDRAVDEYLTGPLAYATDTSVANPQLILTTQRADKLVFTGVPTAATRFGSAGTTEFLEVAPQTVPCNHPLMPHARCLDVRTLHYDAHGLRVGEPGPWRALSVPIEGYTHRPGERSVLRVKRYAIAHPPADGASVAYVLDMVVESHAPKH